MKKVKVIMAVASIVFMAAACNRTSAPVIEKQNYSDGTVELAGKTLRIELAQTPELRQKGLSGRDQLNADEGMLFVFPENDSHTFWMKDMKFSIDIIWIKDNKVAGIDRNVLPEPGASQDSELDLYSPDVPVSRVLEINAGWASANNLNIGDEVTFKLKQ